MKQTHNPLGLHGLGLGTFPFSNVFGKVTAEEASKIVDLYLRHGGGYIQTSPYYAGVESLLGGILAGTQRPSYKIATLCVKDEDSQLSGKRSAVIGQCNASLARLGLDYVDLLMTSTPDATDAPFSETIAAMQELQKQGKIRAIGVCNVTLLQLQEYNATGAVQYVQNRLSLIDQESDRDVRDYCIKHGIGLIPYNVIEWGLLTDKMLETWTLRSGDLRTQVLPVFGQEQKEMLYQWIRASLKPVADQYKTTIQGLAIAWALVQPGVVACPIGATSIAQIASSLQAVALTDSPGLLKKLQVAYDDLVAKVRAEHSATLNDFLKNSYGKW